MADFIVDASVAVKWFVLEELSDRALALVDSDSILAAPDLIRLEVGSALSRRVREGSLEAIQALSGMSALPRYFAELLPFDGVLADAMQISMAIKHPLYDCLYVAVANARQCKIITADQKFVAKLAGTSYAANVVLLGDWKA